MEFKLVIYEYEQILTGKKNSFSAAFFPFNDENNERRALAILKYAIEKYLEWSPEEVKLYLNANIIKLMKLDSVMRFIRFPPELNPKKDYFYIAHKLYPNRIPYNESELVINVYKRVLSGELCKFPKEYRADTSGFMRVKICFQYMLEQFMQFSSINEMYDFFSSSEGTKALKEYKLYSICCEMFESPLEYLHESLPIKQRSEFLYRLYKFNEANASQKRQMKKEGTFVF